MSLGRKFLGRRAFSLFQCPRMSEVNTRIEVFRGVAYQRFCRVCRSSAWHAHGDTPSG